MSGWKPRLSWADRQAAIDGYVRDEIRHAAIDAGLGHSYLIAERCGIKDATFRRKLNHGGWTHEEVCKIISALKIRPESALRMIGVGIPER